MRTPEALDILIGITQSHIVLITVAVNDVRLEFDELDIHRVVDTGSVTVEIRTGTFHRSLLSIVVERYVVCIVFATS